MAEPITNVLGTVAIKHCGEYDATMHYEKLNVVTYNGSSYCAKDNTIGNLPTNTTYWNLMAEKGDKGDKGDTPVKGTDYYTEDDIDELEGTLSSDVTTEVTSQLSNLTSATPLVASSTAGMTDTTRIYVNTNDGHWYWYNGTTWVDGGTYQAAEDSDTVDKLENIVDEIASTLYSVIDKNSEKLTLYNTNGYIDLDSGVFVSANGNKVYYLTVPVDGYIWFDTETNPTRVGIYNNQLFDTNDVVFLGGTTRNTLPYENNKVEVKAGMIVAISIAVQSSNNFSLHIPEKVVLSDNQIDYIDSVLNIQNKVSKDGTDEVTMDNAEFVDVVYTNIFDGNYIDGYVLDGYPTFSFKEMSDRYNLIIVPIKPNTVYTILATPNSDSSNFFKYATATKLLSNNEQCDGAITNSIGARRGDFIQTITTGENDKYLYCYGIDNTNPNSNQFYQICEGTLEHFTTDKYSDFYGVFNDKIRLGTDVQRNIKIQKTDSTHFKVYVPSTNGEKVVRYDFIRYLKTWDSLEYIDGNGETQTATNIESSNYWNNLYVYDGNGNYITQGNSNFITKPKGSRYHVGNGHGNEVMTYLALLADGVDIDFDNMDNGEIKECSNFRFILKSKIYKCSDIGQGNEYNLTSPALDINGDPIVNFIHYMEMNFKIGNDITINNRLIVKQDNIKFEQCHGAMLECYFGDFSNVMCNNTEETRNIIDSSGNVTVPAYNDVNFRNTPYQKCNSVEMFGGNFYIRQDMMQDDPSRNSKSNVVFNFYDNRLKCYFQPVTASFGIQPSETLETFNTGDVISVTDHRVIELN